MQFRILGQIEKGDNEKLLRLVEEHLNREAVAQILIESKGGSVAEAVELGRTASKYLLAVQPGPSGCFSACFFVLAAAPIRMYGYGDVGVHRVYLDRSGAANLPPNQFRSISHELWKQTYEHLDELQVPHEIIELIRNTPSDQMHILTHEQQDLLGFYSAWAREYLLAKCGIGYARGLPTEQQEELFHCSVRSFREEQDRLLGR